MVNILFYRFLNLEEFISVSEKISDLLASLLLSGPLVVLVDESKGMPHLISSSLLDLGCFHR